MSKSARVLYLEDDEMDRRTFMRMVRDKALPWETTYVETLAAARKELAGSRFDVIVADYHLPDGNSAELFDEVRDIPFVLVTATLEEQLALRTLERGADDYLIKDIERRYLGALPVAVEKTLYRKAIHEREQRLAQELRESEQQVHLLAAALETAPNAISVSKTDPQGTIVWVNPAFTTLTGYSAEEAIGHSHHILSSGRQDKGFYRNLWETIERGEVWRGELVNRRKDGTLYQEEMGITPLRDEHGKVTHYVAIKQDITARKEAEAKLRESEERFRAFMDNSPAIAWAKDEQGRHVYLNRAYEKRFGVRVEDWRGKIDAELWPPEIAAKFQEADAAVLSTGRPMEVIEETVNPDGSRCCWWNFKFPFHDAAGHRYVGGMGIDITERKRTEKALQESEERLKLAAEATGYGTFDYNPQTGELLWSAEAKRHFGLGLDAPVDFSVFLKGLHPEDRDRAHRIVQDAMRPESGGFYQTEYRTLGIEDGQKRWLSATGRVFFDEAGRPVRFIGATVDITHRKRAEEQIRAALESAELERRRLDAVLDALPAGVIIADATGRLLRFNDALIRIWGAPPLSKGLEEYGHWRGYWADTGELVAGEDWAMARALRTGQVIPGDVVEIEKFDGSGRATIINTAAPIKDGQGRIVGGVVAELDITAQKRTEEELAAAKAAAEEANRAKDHFLAVLSHELRNPLTPVLPALAAMENLVPEEGTEYLEIARRNVELEARLIDDLLDVTRIARGKIELERKPVPLCEVIHRAAEVCRPDIEARRLHFGIQVEDGPHPVHVDPARLQQVFWNLIKNAVKFTPHGGCVGVRCWRENGRVITQVSDSGQGIEPEALGRIFNAFEQESRATTRQFGGLGLGLAISKALVEMHGGAIQVHSAGKGKGATFTVALPIAQVRPMEKRATPAAEAEPPAAACNLRILLVEDHGDTARMMGRLLTAEGHTVKHAGDVATALELASGGEFDLLVSDVGLPDGSGHDLMRELRARGQRLSGIALSGYGMAEDVQRSHEAGFAEHVTKPVNFEALRAAVNRVANGGCLPDGRSFGCPA